MLGTCSGGLNTVRVQSTDAREIHLSAAKWSSAFFFPLYSHAFSNPAPCVYRGYAD